MVKMECWPNLVHLMIYQKSCYCLIIKFNIKKINYAYKSLKKYDYTDNLKLYLKKINEIREN